MPKRKNTGSGYECNCDHYCSGVPTPVTAADWKKHKPYRVGRFVNALRGVVDKVLGRGEAGNDASNRARGQNLSGAAETQAGSHTARASTSRGVRAPEDEKVLEEPGGSSRRSEDREPSSFHDPPSPLSPPRQQYRSPYVEDDEEEEVVPSLPPSPPHAPYRAPYDEDEEEEEEDPRPQPVPPRAPYRSPWVEDDDEEEEEEPDPVPMPGPDEEPEIGRYEDTGAPRQSSLPDVKLAQQYVEFVKNATLETCGMDEDSRTWLRNPPRTVPDLSEDPTLRLALRQFIANGHSDAVYEANHRACMEEHPERELPSLKSIKKTVEELTGIKPIVTDMCKNSCLAYTGPHAHRTHCHLCPEEALCYEVHKGKNVPRRTFNTYPFGPQAQALMRQRETAEKMHHRRNVVAELKAKLGMGEKWDVAEDVYFSKDFMEAVDDKVINPDDMVLMFSVDGAQLYESKASDCWVYIWVLFDLSPHLRYKKRYVLPGAVIPGPNKPQDLESFLLPGLMHISALQKEGLKIWEASDNRLYISRPVVLFATADTIGMAYINGLVGHSGRRGCRLWCPMPSRHRAGCGFYYPAMLRPHAATRGNDGDDYSARTPLPSAKTIVQQFKAALEWVTAATSRGRHLKRRLETGIGKPSIFSGLTISVGIPTMFPGDVMHHLGLNVPDVMVDLLRGAFECKKPDSVDEWPWAVFRPVNGDDKVFKTHGEVVASMGRYIPPSFGKAPRNIAAKINSGYKAWEHMYHFYMVLPGQLWGVLPEEFFDHYCKLVAGCRFALMQETPVHLRPLAHKLLVEFVEDFERLYYARRLDRLHFCRPAIHLLLHLVPKGIRRGPLWLFSQWVLENFIGNLTCEIGSDSCPYANLAARATRRAQLLGLYAMFPKLTKQEGLPKDAVVLGGGYILLAYGRDDRGRVLPHGGRQATALLSYLHAQNIAVPETWRPAVWKWARLQLPNGQVARTAFGECKREDRGVPTRRSRMVKLRGDNFAEVQYFFRMSVTGDNGEEESRVLAMVSDFTPPDHAIAAKTHGVMMVCYYQGKNALRVIDAKDILSVVAMMPLPPRGEELLEPDAARQYANCFYVGEKLGCDMAWIGRGDNANDKEEGEEN